MMRRALRLLGKGGLYAVVGLVCLELFLRLVGWGYTRYQQMSNPQRHADGALTILCLGDSVTAFGGPDAYPHQLQEMLDAADAGRRFRVVNAAIPGTGSSAILSRLHEQLATHDPWLVTVMMGVNDYSAAFGGGEAPQRPAWMDTLDAFRVWRLGSLLRWRYDRARRRRATEARQARQEQELLAQIENDGASPRVRMELAVLYHEQSRTKDARRVLEKLMETQPGPMTYRLLSRVSPDPEERRRLVQQALRRYPRARMVYHWMSRVLIREGRWSEIEELYQTQIQHIGDIISWMELGIFYRGRGRLDEAERVFQRTLRMQPNFYSAAQLGLVYAEQERYDEAEAMLRESLRLRSCPFTWVELGRLLHELDRDDEAEQALLEAVELGDIDCGQREFTWNQHLQDPNQPYIELSRLYQEQGDTERAYAVLQQIDNDPVLFANYRRLVEQVMARVGQLAVVQYPTLSPAPLRAMIPQREGLIFVDNEQNFEDALERDGYAALFIDREGVDFGHCTPAGHRLIARSLADAILETWFPESAP